MPPGQPERKPQFSALVMLILPFGVVIPTVEPLKAPSPDNTIFDFTPTRFTALTPAAFHTAASFVGSEFLKTEMCFTFSSFRTFTMLPSPSVHTPSKGMVMRSGVTSTDVILAQHPHHILKSQREVES